MATAPFERVVVVDWSANSRPTRGRDSIWIAVLDGTGVSTANPATRAQASAEIEECCRRSGRVLVGVDFSLGCPAGTAHALGLTGSGWRATWGLLTAMIDDADDNANNRFEVAAELNARLGPGPGPFWGCPPSRATTTLTPTKVAPTPLPEWRLVERELRRRALRPFSSWQLLGAGSVGSQSLLGIPRLTRLERVLVAAGRTVDVWPFTGDDPTADVVIAEVWPSLHPVSVPPGRIRDEVQVVETAQRLAGRSFSLSLPALPSDERRIVAGEEGWIIGA
ncbi:hypothetical protein [Ilumatobacter nonamiensis]|uniref:hypothetical protein n=1 Tax=Ilumatobacter nonamiensis TaxID=467093 RepID=UPI00034B60CF|nr:hypothetical protein [Ilumatobacter nonamiensis]